MVNDPPANAGDARDTGLIPDWEDPLEKEMAISQTHTCAHTHTHTAVVQRLRLCPSTPRRTGLFPGQRNKEKILSGLLPYLLIMAKEDNKTCVPAVTQSYPTHCDPMDCILPGSSVHGILQARTLEWPRPPLGDLPDPGIEPRSLMSPALACGFFATSASWEVG